MKYLSPVFFAKRLTALIKDIINFFKYVKTTKELETTGKLGELGLRRTSLGRLYYVKNMQPEVLLNIDELPDFELMQVKESLAQYNEPIAALGLIDYIKTGFKRIKTPDVYAYIIWMEYNISEISASKIIYALLYPVFFVLIIAKVFVPLAGLVDWHGVFNVINSK